MKVLVIGSGAREHCLVWKIAQSPLVDKVFATPGNAGMAKLAECRDIKAEDIEGLVSLAKEEKIDLTLVGPEKPLVAGIVDKFNKEGLKIFGPTQKAAELEGSKVLAKDLMKKYGVPTAEYRVFDKATEAKDYVSKLSPPFVIKADGLAAGKGSIIVDTPQQGEEVIRQIMEEKIFGEAANRVIVEDCLFGEELSILAFTDGRKLLPLASSQDHKRAYDNDQGPNTGGMGAYSPCPLVSDEDMEAMVRQTAEPLVRGLSEEGIVYRGIIYAGLMLTKDGPYVLEYNVRFGDPETQAILPRMKDDIVPILMEVADGQLRHERLHWDHRYCINVVMASKGYPDQYEKGFEIRGLDKFRASEEVMVFHAGSIFDNRRRIVTSGGRVLGVSVLAKTLKQAQDKVYGAIQKIDFQGAFYRHDIGWRALKENVKL